MENSTANVSVECLGCGSNAPESLFDHWGMLELEGVIHEVKSAYHWCPDCGTVSALPPPSERILRRHYETMPAEDALLGSERARTAMDWILAHGSFSSVLEIGCGNGELLALLRAQTGCEVQGVDPSVVRQTKATTSRVPIVKSLDELEPGKRFELVISSHALEHVVDPGAMLRVLAERVTDDGLVYVEVPALELSNVASEQTIHLTHLHHWTGSTLAAICRNHGLVPHRSREDLVKGYPCARILCRPGQAPSAHVDVASARAAFEAETRKIQRRYQGVANAIRRSDGAVIFGAGSDALHMLRTESDVRHKVRMIVESNPAKQGQTLCGIPVRPLQDRPAGLPVYLLAMMPSTQASMRKSLETRTAAGESPQIFSPQDL